MSISVFVALMPQSSRTLSAQGMVTHNWSNLFLHLVAGILADALGKEYYAGIAEKLLTKRGVRELEAAIQEQAELKHGRLSSI